MKLYNISYQGYSEKRELVLTGSGGYSGTNEADVTYSLEMNLKLAHPEVVHLNINVHGYTE